VKDFNGKAVVVTGAASGIGREMALAFARRGARLAVADIDEARLLGVKGEMETMGNQVNSWVVDVSRAEAVKDFCDDVYREMGRVDVLCNNAGIGMGGKFEDTTLEDWQWIVGVNLWGIIHGCHYFYPRMIEQGGGGHIVNTASGAGLAPLPIMVPYCCTKYAVVGFSETLRAEAALHGIGVSAICPGIVITNITKVARITSDTNKSTAQEFLEKLDRIYVKRNYTPDRVAAAAVKAVERNKGVVPVCPETYVGDYLHRISRKLNDYNLKQSVKLLLNRL
jgi:NAD(P)-dependent dehydrogenase (short-subunit alcohol dehydrogenase family)